MKLHRNVFGMFSFEFRIKMFQNATVAMVTIKVKAYVFNDCNVTSQNDL